MALKNPSSYSTQSRELLDEFDELAGLGDEQNGGSGERNAYLVEHLATFTVTRETGILYPADGMRRLLQLEKSNGIWSQKMQLCLDGPWVLIMDYETGSIMERFPATLIQEPTAFTSSDPVELYNNILAFIVAPPNERGRSPSPRREMHIFQCHNINAQDLVEDLKLLKGGSSGGRLSHLDSGSDTAGREFAIERERMRENNDVEKPRRAQMAHLSHYRERGSDSEAAGVGQEDEVSSTSSDRLYEQDIAILNRCFDDIEKFIARLQHAAAASRELERRRRSRKSKKHSVDSAGEGMLALRTRPPPERDFRDVLQKFKLSFNLLARLRAHIHDPNAPELVHFLFTPLALIVDASHDASPDGKLASRVIQPLLTREALNLLANCVTSKETELWHSLGDAWLIPREQWKGSVPPYQPVFMDGWTPDYIVEDQTLQRSSPRRTDIPPAPYQAYIPEDQDTYGEQYAGAPYARNNKQQRGSADSGSAGSSPEREIPSSRRPPPLQIHHQSKDMSLDSVDQGGVLGDDEREGGSLNSWIRACQARGARLVTVTYPRTANNDKELTVHRGEILEVLDDTRKWWKARNRQGLTAHVPHTIVAPYQPSANSQADVFNNPVYTPHYQDNQPRRSDAESPASATASFDESTSTDINSPSCSPILFNSKIQNERKEHQKTEAAAPAPPPPPESPLWKSRPTTPNRNSVSGKSLRSLGLEEVHEELKRVLNTKNENKRKIDIKKTPNLFIQQSSTEEEVQGWLEAKGFDDDVRKKLHIDGAKLFALNKTQLQSFVGRHEGKRLYSQILVQRNVSGYKTTTSSELNNILKKVREKVEVKSEAH